MLLIRSSRFVLLTFIPVLVLIGRSRAQGNQDVFLEEISSVSVGDSLAAFEIETTPLSVSEATRFLEAAITTVLNIERLPERDRRDVSETIQADGPTAGGTLRSNPAVEFELDLRTRRLDITNDDPSGASRDNGRVRSQEDAVERARRIVERLHEREIIDRRQFDMAEPEVGIQKAGFGEVGKPYERANEVIVDYRITFKRVVNKIPVVGSYARVVVDQGGGISQLNLSLRELRAEQKDDRLWPTGTGAWIRIDRPSEAARKDLREKSLLSGSSRLHVERWGIAYFDSGMPSQKYLQPVYVFLATTLTETERGTIAGRKGVRVVPASSVTLEVLPFDPLRPDDGERIRPRGDPRR